MQRCNIRGGNRATASFDARKCNTPIGCIVQVTRGFCGWIFGWMKKMACCPPFISTLSKCNNNSTPLGSTTKPVEKSTGFLIQSIKRSRVEATPFDCIRLLFIVAVRGLPSSRNRIQL